MNKVAVLGSCVVDTLYKSSDFKVVKSHLVESGVALCEVLGGKVEAKVGGVVSGGGGSNVSVGLRRLGGCSIRIISKVGEDMFGRFIKDNLESELVDTTCLRLVKGSTGFSSVLVSDTGARSIVTFRGVSSNIQVKDIDWETVKNSNWLQISSLGGQVDTLEDVVNYCFESGVRVGLNPGRLEIENGLMNKILKRIDFLCLNRQEASLLSGLDYSDETNIVKYLMGLGVRVVVMSDGGRGANLIYGGTWLKSSVFKEKVIDDTGAGDAFVSGFLSGYLKNKNLDLCLKMGVLNGGNVVRFLGAKHGLLKDDEMSKKINLRKLQTVEETF